MTETPDSEAVTHGGDLSCSFCGKSRHEVRKLVSGPKGVFTCNECAGLVMSITHEQATLAPGDEGDDAIVERVHGELDRNGWLNLLARGQLDIRILLVHVVQAARHPLVRYINELEATIKKQRG